MNSINADDSETIDKIEKEELNLTSIIIIKYEFFKDWKYAKKNYFSHIDLLFSQACILNDIFLNGYYIQKLSINKMNSQCIRIQCDKIKKIYFYESIETHIELYGCDYLENLELFACENLNFVIKDENNNKISLCAWDMTEFNYNGYETNRFSKNIVFDCVSYFDLDQLINFKLDSRKYLLEEASFDDLKKIEEANIEVKHINTVKLDCHTLDFSCVSTLVNLGSFFTNLVVSNFNIEYFCVSNSHAKHIKFENINIENLLIRDCNLNSLIIINGQIDKFEILNSHILALTLYSNDIINLNINNSFITNYSECFF